jgi:prevent-host-death family protein
MWRKAMPESIGVRELKNQTSRVLRAVREEMAEYIVTLHGKPVAVLRPLTEEESLQLQQHEIEKSTAEMKAIAQEVAAAWTANKSGVELISEQRR